MDNAPARLEMAVLRTARSVRRAFDARLRPLGLNLTQASLLSFLGDLGALTQRELADQREVVGRLQLERLTAGRQDGVGTDGRHRAHPTA